MELVAAIALVAVVVAACVWLGMVGARSTGKGRVIVTFAIAWCIGTLFVGVPAYCVGWIIQRHRHPVSAA